MAAYLTVNRPARSQWYQRRSRPLTGCTVLHTAESVMDTVGPDTGAENVADFIRRRTTPGSYHDLVDSDTALQLVEYVHGAYHDGTGSNNWALSLSFACRTSDWRNMSTERRRGFLHQGAVAFKRQQDWRKANGYPLTELRLISKAQSDAGMSGFTYHGLRDPGRRSDPGVSSPNLFPFDEFIDECRAVLRGADTTPEDEVTDADKRDIILGVIAELKKADFSPAEGTQSLQNIVSQTRSALVEPVARISPNVGAGDGDDLGPVSRAKMIEYVEARTRRIEEDVAEVLALLKAQQPPAA